MPRFAPFPGLRYSPSHIGALDDVVCPPYDVIAEHERRELLARSPYNVVRLELPVGGDPDPYTAAARLLDAWRDGGVLRRDSEPAFYGCRMRFVDESGDTRTMVGVIGALDLEAPGAGILPHEETTPKAKSDRYNLLAATRANLSPIWALTPVPGLDALCAAPPQPVEHTRAADGTTCEVWPVTDGAAVAAIGAHVASAPVLIADGHHRYETALRFMSEDADPGARAVMAFVVSLDEEQLAVRAIHRVVRGVDPAALLGRLGESFTLSPTAPPDAGIIGRMEEAGGIAVVTAAGTWLGQATEATRLAATHDLDASRLDVALAPLGSAEVTFQHGWDLAVAQVGAGATAAVLLRPASVAQIAAISRGGVRMPAKTTFFWPKPPTGLVLRELQG